MITPEEKHLSTTQFKESLLELLDAIRGSEFSGVCLLIDDAEYIVQQKWGNDAWSFLRALVDDSSIRSLLGLYLSGYRNLHDYQQTVGSPLLSIADIHWLDAFTDAEATILINKRYNEEGKEITESDRIKLIEWGGCHPYLTHNSSDSF